MLKPCPDAVGWYTTPVPPPGLSLMITHGLVSDTPGILFKVNALSNSNCKCNVGINKNDSNYICIFTKTRQCFKDEQFEMALVLKINKKLWEKTYF